MLILGEAISILALNTFSPSAYMPFFIFSKSSRFSSTERSLYGLSLPGSVSVPLYSLICSAVRSHTYALPFLISLTAASYILSKYPDANNTSPCHLAPSHSTSALIESTNSSFSLVGLVSSNLKLN